MIGWSLPSLKKITPSKYKLSSSGLSITRPIASLKIKIVKNPFWPRSPNCMATCSILKMTTQGLSDSTSSLLVLLNHHTWSESFWMCHKLTFWLNISRKSMRKNMPKKNILLSYSTATWKNKKYKILVTSSHKVHSKVIFSISKQQLKYARIWITMKKPWGWPNKKINTNSTWKF